MRESRRLGFSIVQGLGEVKREGFFRAGGRATRTDVGRRDAVGWQEKESYAKSHQYKKISYQYLIDCDLFFIW